MHRFTTLGVAALLAIGGPALAASPALAGPGHGRHSPPMNISPCASGTDTSAHWLPKRQAVKLSVGTDAEAEDDAEACVLGGTSGTATLGAGFVVHHLPSTATSTEPTLTASPPGSPWLILEIDFAGGGYIQRTADPAGNVVWAAYDSSGTQLGDPAATDYVSALSAAGPSAAVVGLTVVDDASAAGATATDTISALQYGGTNLVPATNRGQVHGHSGSGHGHSGGNHS